MKHRITKSAEERRIEDRKDGTKHKLRESKSKKHLKDENHKVVKRQETLVYKGKKSESHAMQKDKKCIIL